MPAYSFWQYYIKNGIVETGHHWSECPEVDWALGLVPKREDEQTKWKTETWDKTLKWLKENPSDIFLSYLYPQQVDKSAIREIQKMGIPCINFFCDNVREFNKVPVEFDAFDLNWVPEYKAVKFYKTAGYPHINLPMPVWVNPQSRAFFNENNRQITFIGSRDIQRQLLFEDIILRKPDIPVAIYGNGWADSELMQPPSGYNFSKQLQYQYQFIKKNGPDAYLQKLKNRNVNTALSHDLKSKIYRSPNLENYNKLTAGSMITIGINRYPSFHFPLNKPDSYSRLRDIEAPMLGACYLTEWTDGIEQLYETGNEIEVYRDAEEFIQKTNELSANTEKRKKLKMNGQKKALADLTIPQSLNKIIQRIN